LTLRRKSKQHLYKGIAEGAAENMLFQKQ